MIERDDELTELLDRLDPVTTDPPPELGSIRYQNIEDTIMTNLQTSPSHPTPVQGPDAEAGHWRRRALVLVAVAAAALAIGVGLFVAPRSTPSAAAAVRAAAENNADVTDFRVTFASDDFTFLPGGVATADIDGDNFHMTAGDMEMIRVGGTEWLGEGGRYRSEPAADVFAPFGEASAQVVAAALASNRVDLEGTEVLRGIETTRYRIQVDDASRAALADVPSRAQYWFTAETSEGVIIDEDGNEVPVSAGRSGFLEDADALAIWVADDLIHQIEVSTGSTQFVITFFDFGADITVTPPR